jgi:hypothetical protein
MTDRVVRAIVFTACMLWARTAVPAAGGKESSSGGSVETAASVGTILASSEVKIDSLLATVNQSYPEPTEPLGILVRSGHRQISNQGQGELLLVGVQGKRIPFQDLPPMNIAFVIDKSGSMSEAGRLDWVKESFGVFIDKVRPRDFVSLILFDSNAQVAFPPTSMSAPGTREALRAVVQATSPGGGTNLRAGLELGYEQVMGNFRGDYVNRVIFLTDGRGESQGILDMAESYRKLGIGVSAVGLGAGFDAQLIRDLAFRGGGSSRFISDRPTMVEAFGEGLPRMVAALASDLTLNVVLDSGVTVRAVWAYESEVQGSSVRLRFDSVHVGDYETVMIELETGRTTRTGAATLATVTGSYRDWSGRTLSVGPTAAQVTYVDDPRPLDGYSDPYVLRGATALEFGRALMEIGDIHGEAIRLPEGDTRRTDLLNKAIGRTKRMREESANAAMRLETAEFDRYVRTADLYLKTLGAELQWAEPEVERYTREPSLDPGPAKRSFLDEAQTLFREIRAEVAGDTGGRLAVAGFTATGAPGSPILDLLDRTAEAALAGTPGMVLVERRDLDRVLNEQALGVSDLMATESAVKVGRLLAATHILTGTVIPMKDSVVVFARVVNVESGVMESAAQVVVPRTPEVEGLLGAGR